MRDTLILLTKVGDYEELRGRIFALGEHYQDVVFRHVDTGSCLFGVAEGNRILDDYEPDELREVREALGDFSPLLIEYQNADCARRLLSQVLPRLSGILDTNYEKLLTYSEVLSEIERDPDWDLRV